MSINNNKMRALLPLFLFLDMVVVDQSIEHGYPQRNEENREQETNAKEKNS